jgi:uncharacterized protein
MKSRYHPHKLRLACPAPAAQNAGMISRLLLLLLTLSFALASGRAADKSLPAPAPSAAPKLDPDLTIYYVCLLTKGAFYGVGEPAERRKTQAAQNAYINELASSGKLLVAGPFADKSEWQGIYIFRCASDAEAKTLALGDPEIRANRLKFEIHAWITAKGSIRDPAFPPGK